MTSAETSAEIFDNPRGAAEDQRKAHRLRGKGWTVFQRREGRTRYTGYAMRYGVKVKDDTKNAYFLTRDDAIRYAIAHAHKAGTLDWKKTVLWLKLMRIDMPIEGLSFPVHYSRFSTKGWYMIKNTQGGVQRWVMRVGEKYDTTRYLCAASTPRMVFSKAIALGLIGMPHFDIDASIAWLQSNGHDALTTLLTARKTA